MIVSPAEFMEVSVPKGFGISDVCRQATEMTADLHSLDLAKMNGNRPYMVLYTGADVFAVQFLNKNNTPLAQEDDNYLVPFFELLKHVAH
jgi:hypothetical protein